MPFIHNLASNQDSQEPKGIVRYVIGDRATICKDRKQFEAKRLISLQNLSESLDLVEKPEQSEDFPS